MELVLADVGLDVDHVFPSQLDLDLVGTTRVDDVQLFFGAQVSFQGEEV